MTRPPARRLRARSVLIVSAVALLLLWTLIPVIWLVMTAFKQNLDILTFPPKFIFEPTLANFQRVLARGDFHRWFGNSVYIASGTTLLSLAFGALAAYGFSRFRFRGKSTALIAILLARMVPPIVLVVPMFLLASRLELTGSHLILILAHTSFNLPLVIWMMKTFFDDVPVELEEAAAIDGCSVLGRFLRITVPVALPGIAATSILAFIMSWNEFLFALIFTGGQQRTLPVGIAGYIGDLVLDFGAIASAAVLIMLPMLILGIFVQRHIVRGFSMGAVKG